MKIKDYLPAFSATHTDEEVDKVCDGIMDRLYPDSIPTRPRTIEEILLDEIEVLKNKTESLLATKMRLANQICELEKKVKDLEGQSPNDQRT